MTAEIKKIIANTFFDMAGALENGEINKRPVIAVAGLSSEHGEKNALEGALAAARQGVDVIYIGTLANDGIQTIYSASEEEAHAIMESLLKSGEADGIVTMHYPFPIGVSTVGRVAAPATGSPLYIASTTGASASRRVEAMVKNTLAGIAVAKACGVQEPTVGILNIDGARQCEGVLQALQSNGYPIRFAASNRTDGGSIMRGNDLLMGSADIMVADSLTGNLLMKMISAYASGGSYESTGWGYGPGIGEGYDKLVMIVSRASGSAVIARAIRYAAELVRGGYKNAVDSEFKSAAAAKMQTLLAPRKTIEDVATAASEPPAKEIVTASVSGVDIMELDNAVHALWAEGVYAESGMGCTGPIILINNDNLEKAETLLAKSGFTVEPQC